MEELEGLAPEERERLRARLERLRESLVPVRAAAEAEEPIFDVGEEP